MIDIVITADYEIFGNGTGDVWNCLARPTDDLLNICGEFGAKLTLFFEIIEYWAFKKAEAGGKLGNLSYSPVELMESQARKAIQGGHDVQLHLHPQWLDSEYTQDGWRVNFDYWRLPNVPHGLGDFDDVLSLRGLLSKGKHDLERMFKPLFNGYECVALRAGDHCIQPARDVIRAMKEVGFLAESSIFKGGYIQEEPFDIDFRNAYSESMPWWADPDDINKASASSNDTILELPIYTLQQRRIAKLTIRKALQWFRRRNAQYPPDCIGNPALSLKNSSTPKTPVEFFKYLTGSVFTRWDYCGLTDNEMWCFLKRSVKKNLGIYDYLPLVMIGHPKTFVNHINFRRFLKRLTRASWFRNGEVGFSTMRDAIRKVLRTRAGVAIARSPLQNSAERRL